MGHKKRPRPKKDAAHLKGIVPEILKDVISGLLVAALVKLLKL